MTLNIENSCTVYSQHEFLNVLANQMTGQKTLNIGSSCKVFHQYELLDWANDFEHWEQLNGFSPV